MGCTAQIRMHFQREKHARWAMHVADEMIRMIYAPDDLPWVRESQALYATLSKRYLYFRQHAAEIDPRCGYRTCALDWLRRERTDLVIERCQDIMRWTGIESEEELFPQLCYAYALRFPQVPFTALYRYEMTVSGAIQLIRMQYDGAVMHAQELTGEWPMDEDDWSEAYIYDYVAVDEKFVLQKTVDPKQELKERRLRIIKNTMREIEHRCRPLLAAVCGSIAYGLDTEESDIDIRGIFLNPPEELIGLKPEQESIRFTDSDTVLYGLRKAMKLLLDCNPNVVELLGLRDEDILYCPPAGRMILDNASIFLSQKAIFTYGAYAVKRRREIQRLIDAKAPPQKIAKEMMHLIRIYATGCDLLEDGRVTAFRRTDRRLLMRIRSGEYQDGHGMPTADYERLLTDWMGCFNGTALRTRLPAEPDREKANELTMEIIRRSLF